MPARGRKKIQSERRKKLNQPRDDIDGWREWAAEKKEAEDRVAAAGRRCVLAAVTVAVVASAFYALDSPGDTSVVSALVFTAATAAAAVALAFTLGASASSAAASAGAVTTQPAETLATRACPTRATIHRDRTQGSAYDHYPHHHHHIDTDNSNNSNSGMMFRIARLVEAIQTVRRSVIDYSYAAASSGLSTALTVPPHHALLTDEATVERHKQQQVSSSIEIAPAFQPTSPAPPEPQDDDEPLSDGLQQTPPPPPSSQQQQLAPPEKPKLKKKRKTRGRAESMYSSTVTIEEFTVLPARRRSSIASFDEYMDVPERHDSFVTIEEYTVLPARRPNAITTPAVSPPTSAARAVVKNTHTAANPQDSVTDMDMNACVPVVSDDVAQETPVVEQLVAETPATTSLTTPKKPRARRRSKSMRAESSEVVVATAEPTPAAAMIATIEAAPVATPVVELVLEQQQQQKIEAEVVQVPESAKVPAPVFEVSAVDTFDTFGTNSTERADAATDKDEEAADRASDPMLTEIGAALGKPRRRRQSRRRSRSRRSTLSFSERPSSYDEFLLLEPAFAKATAPTLAVDKNQALYVAEAARVRALQSAPIDSTRISTPAIRLMVDELNTQLARTHAALAANWDFLASLTPEVAEPEIEPECCSRSHKPALSLDSTEVDDDDFALRDSELMIAEDDDEDDIAGAYYGDVDYDDHYYSYHSMSTPCV